MHLVPNWKRIAAKAHSMWAIYLGVLCLLMPDAIYYLAERDTNPRWWFFLALALFVYGAIFRLKGQGIDHSKLKSPPIVMMLALMLLAGCEDVKTASNDEAGVTIAPVEIIDTAPGDVSAPPDAFAEIAVPFIGRWEGLRLDAYLDVVGVPTVCYGETKGVTMSDSYTKAECDAMLAREVQRYRKGLHAHFTPETISVRLTIERDVAYTSLAYNAGVRAISKSTAVRRLNGGDIVGGCNALGWWNKAGGRVIRGLVRRRSEEIELCLKGVT